MSYILILASAHRLIQDTAAGRKIKSDIIPAVAHLCQLYPLKLHLVFPSHFLDISFPNQEIDCTDLALNDQVFDQFMYQ